VRVLYDGASLFVFCDTSGVLKEPILRVDNIAFNKILNLDPYGACYVGFTSSTGKSSEYHEIYDIQVEGCQPLVSGVDLDIDDVSEFSASMVPTPALSEASIVLSHAVSSTTVCTIVDL